MNLGTFCQLLARYHPDPMNALGSEQLSQYDFGSEQDYLDDDEDDYENVEDDYSDPDDSVDGLGHPPDPPPLNPTAQEFMRFGRSLTVKGKCWARRGRMAID